VDRGGISGGTSSASAGQITIQLRPPGFPLDLALANLKILTDLRAELDADFEFSQSGGTVIAEGEDEARLLKQFVEIQSKNLPIEFLDTAALRKAEPFLSHHVVAGTYCPLDGFVNPMLLGRALCRALRRLGGDVRLRTPVVGLVRDETTVHGVQTPAGRIAGGAVVNAAGVWSPDIGSMAGVRIPVVPRRGQLVVSEPAPLMLRAVISHASYVPFRDFGLPLTEEEAQQIQQRRYLRYMKQVRHGGFAGRFYIGSTSEFVGFDRATTAAGVADLARYARQIVPLLARVCLMRTWAGLRPRSRDTRFIIGPTAGLRSFFIGTGLDSIGVLNSGVTGLYLAQLITGETPVMDLSVFSPDRESLHVAG
jgi:sarcosine oxidase subunit beta